MPIEKIAIKIKKVITFQKIIKKGLKKDMTNFLQTPNKLSSKKKKQINKSKQKASLEKISLKKGIINSLHNPKKKNC